MDLTDVMAEMLIDQEAVLVLPVLQVTTTLISQTAVELRDDSSKRHGAVAMSPWRRRM